MDILPTPFFIIYVIFLHILVAFFLRGAVYRYMDNISSKTNLNPNELEALRILWDAGSALKPAEVEKQFSWHIENGALRHVLTGLVDKNLAIREKKGKAFFYKATASQKKILKHSFSNLSRIFTQGSKFGLITQLIKAEKLSAQEIRELQKITQGSGKEK